MTYQEWLGFMQQYLQSAEKYSSIYSGQQIDTAVGKALNPDTTPTANSSALVTSGGVKSAIINQNLLDNPGFSINQRGVTTGIPSGAYGPDRWIVYNSQSENVTIQNGAVLPVNGSVLQRLDAVTIAALTGRAVTASALIEQNGSLSLISGTVASFSASGASQYFTSQNLSILLTDNSTRSIQFFANSACTLKAVKLELGDTQTLAHQENGVWVLNEVPNFQQELAKCQRYQLMIKGDEVTSFGTAISYGNYLYGGFIPTPVPLRAKPIATITGTVTSYSPANNFVSCNSVDASGISENGVAINVTLSSSVLNDNIPTTLMVYYGGGSLLLDANL